MDFDYIVVGAGAAGCVIASRLSERPACRVLLVEAGPDIVPEPPSIRSPYPISHAMPEFRWPDLTANAKAARPGGSAPPPAPYLQARVVGGGGSLMGMFALRGQPDDYDEWARAGAAGWSWADVLPFFRRLEHDLEFGGDQHGMDGPIPIRRHPQSVWSPFAQAVGRAFETRGAEFIADANADFRDGHLMLPCSSLPDRRMSSASAYLNAAARARPNLTLMPLAEVSRIVIEDRRAVGIDLAGPDRCRIGARRVILCAGAIHSPLLLQRSGVGPAAALAAIGIEPACDLRGVGANLRNHPAIYISAVLPRRIAAKRGSLFYNGLRYSSQVADCPPHDMFLPVINRTAWHTLGDRIAGLGACVYKTFSSGKIALARDRGRLVPAIDLGLFADERDLVRIAEGFRRVHGYLAEAQRALPGMTIFAPTNASLAARLARPGWRNGATGWLAAAMLGGPGILRRRVIDGAGIDPRPLLDDDDALNDFVYRHAAPMYHPAGSCRMGSPDDPAAVVDSRCRVIGIDRLLVADASIMPTIVRGNTNIPTVMIGERAAALVVESERQAAS